jgi:hypothetical protein
MAMYLREFTIQFGTARAKRRRAGPVAGQRSRRRAA